MKKFMVLFYKGGFPTLDVYASSATAEEAVKQVWSNAEFYGVSEYDEIRVFELVGQCESFSVISAKKKYSYHF